MKRTFMNIELDMVDVRKYNQFLCEKGVLSPKEYWKSLKETWAIMTGEEKLRESKKST